MFLFFRVDPDNLDEKYQHIIDITADVLSGVSRTRPDCEAVMKQRKEWALDYSDVQQEVENTVHIDTEYDFVLKFLQTKQKLHNK